MCWSAFSNSWFVLTHSCICAWCCSSNFLSFCLRKLSCLSWAFSNTSSCIVLFLFFGGSWTGVSTIQGEGVVTGEGEGVVGIGEGEGGTSEGEGVEGIGEGVGGTMEGEGVGGRYAEGRWGKLRKEEGLE